jgi:hypothetical protein
MPFPVPFCLSQECYLKRQVSCHKKISCLHFIDEEMEATEHADSLRSRVFPRWQDPNGNPGVLLMPQCQLLEIPLPAPHTSPQLCDYYAPNWNYLLPRLWVLTHLCAARVGVQEYWWVHERATRSFWLLTHKVVLIMWICEETRGVTAVVIDGYCLMRWTSEAKRGEEIGSLDLYSKGWERSSLRLVRDFASCLLKHRHVPALQNTAFCILARCGGLQL